MKQTAVGELIEYFVKQQKEGCSHWCIHDLIAQLYVSKEMEKEQIKHAYNSDRPNLCAFTEGTAFKEYYNKNFK